MTLFFRARVFFSNLPSFFFMILRWAGFGSRLSYDDILSSLLLLRWVVMGCDENSELPSSSFH